MAAHAPLVISLSKSIPVAIKTTDAKTLQFPGPRTWSISSLDLPVIACMVPELSI